ncbi:MAG: hypothetical protein JSV68_03040, partial [Anaerolineaceae bacterium]
MSQIATDKASLSVSSADTDRGLQGDNILEIRGLKTYFFTEAGVVRAVDGVDLVVKRGEVLGV